MDGKVFGNYTMLSRIGAGSFGQIYLCEQTKTGERFAAKIESTHARVPQLAFESKLYKLFSGGNNVAKVHWYGVDQNNNILIMDLLGKSLEGQREGQREGQKQLSLRAVLMLADQMISCVEFLHHKHFIHRDIKPDNFVLGTGSECNKVYIIDFGLAKRYRDPLTLTHMKYSDGRSLTGTARYASVNALRGIEQSRRDDMEALGYVWLYLLRGDLPWMGLNAATPQKKYQMICDCKLQISFESLCESFPSQFVEYLKSVRSLNFADEPPYTEYRKMFHDLFLSFDYVYNGIFDWSICGKKRPRKALLPPIPITSPPSGQRTDAKKRPELPIFRTTSGSSLLSGTVNSIKVNAHISSVENIDSDSFTKQCADLKNLLNISDSDDSSGSSSTSSSSSSSSQSSPSESSSFDKDESTISSSTTNSTTNLNNDNSATDLAAIMAKVKKCEKSSALISSSSPQPPISSSSSSSSPVTTTTTIKKDELKLKLQSRKKDEPLLSPRSRKKDENMLSPRNMKDGMPPRPKSMRAKIPICSEND